MTQEDLGKELRENSDKIVECILLLREQRAELAYIIERQYEERQKLENEMEKITYKLCLINKSLAQRTRAKTYYDQTLDEIEAKYVKLVRNSGELLCFIQKQFDELNSLINKQTSTDDPIPDDAPIKHGNRNGMKIEKYIIQNREITDNKYQNHTPKCCCPTDISQEIKACIPETKMCYPATLNENITKCGYKSA